MALFDLFRQKGILSGTITVQGLPPHIYFKVSVAFFRVTSPTSPLPFGGKPPVDQYTDEVVVKAADAPENAPLTFKVERPTGFYFMDVCVMACVDREGKSIAQQERSFPLHTATEIKGGEEQTVALLVDWPSLPFEELGTCDLIRP